MSYLESRARWIAAGRPLRTHDEVKSLFQVCEGCPLFQQIKPGVGRCKACGCFLKRSGKHFNKLAWGTESCPEGKW